ncbi:MAG: diguanylate cyclase [Polyangiaceae bacterium]|nr:diguanylate cyclase [Polyangiaceae bacterium]
MKAKVLVVEDSTQQRAHLVGLLGSRGYSVIEATGGFDALRVIKAERPDVVILDVVLDDLDGYSVCRWLRLTDTTRDMAIIMLTVKGQVRERVEGLHVGADDYLPKPYDDDELEARIYAAMRNRADRQDLRKRNAELEGMLTKTEHLAMTDVVTNLVNRRRFSDVLRREWAAAKRYGYPVSCALIDVDYFKQVNDRYGHGAGDETLRRVADLVRGNIREVDLAARLGGDEFALLLPHTPLDKSKVVLERIRERLHAERKAWGPPGEISLSVGTASTEDDAIRTPDDLIEAADRALYDAKRAGKDRVATARPFEAAAS